MPEQRDATSLASPAVVTDIVCPYCKAPVGEACKTLTSGALVPFNHDSRRAALRRAKR